MKTRYLFLIVVFFTFIYLPLFSQDTIVLKNGKIMEALIIQMDYGNVYYKDWNGKNNDIKTIRNSEIEEVFFKKYSDLYRNRDTTNSEDNRGYSRDNPEKADNLADLPNKPFGVNIDILPTIDLSINLDASKYINFELGLGIGYFYFGGKGFISKPTKVNRLYIGAYLYKFSLFNTNTIFGSFPIGINFRSKYGLELKAEAGLLVKSDLILPMVRLGGGFRF